MNILFPIQPDPVNKRNFTFRPSRDRARLREIFNKLSPDETSSAALAQVATADQIQSETQDLICEFTRTGNIDKEEIAELNDKAKKSNVKLAEILEEMLTKSDSEDEKLTILKTLLQFGGGFSRSKRLDWCIPSHPNYSLMVELVESLDPIDLSKALKSTLDAECHTYSEIAAIVCLRPDKLEIIDHIADDAFNQDQTSADRQSLLYHLIEKCNPRPDPKYIKRLYLLGGKFNKGGLKTPKDQEKNCSKLITEKYPDQARTIYREAIKSPKTLIHRRRQAIRHYTQIRKAKALNFLRSIALKSNKVLLVREACLQLNNHEIFSDQGKAAILDLIDEARKADKRSLALYALSRIADLEKIYSEGAPTGDDLFDEEKMRLYNESSDALLSNERELLQFPENYKNLFKSILSKIENIAEVYEDINSPLNRSNCFDGLYHSSIECLVFNLGIATLLQWTKEDNETLAKNSLALIVRSGDLVEDFIKDPGNAEDVKALKAALT